MELSGRGSDKVICKERKLLFLHIPKTGGRSIQKCVFGGIKGNPHRRALSLRNKIKSEFSDYLIFSFVRNPWERLVSLYHYLKNGFGNTSQDRELTERVGMLSFEEFAANPAITAELVDFRKEEMRSMLIPQVDYLFDDSGRWLPTFLGRFEQIQEDMNRLCALVGAKTGFGHLNGSEHEAYQMYYSDELIQAVGKYYENDVRMFGYTFESLSVGLKESKKLIQKTSFNIRKKANRSIEKIIPPYRGEFGHKLMKHYAAVNGVRGSTLVYGEVGERMFYPGAAEFVEVPRLEDSKRRQNMPHDQEFRKECIEDGLSRYPGAEVCWPVKSPRKFFIPKPLSRRGIKCDVVVPPRYRAPYGTARNWDGYEQLVKTLQFAGYSVFLAGAPDSSCRDIEAPCAWDYEDYTSATVEALLSSRVCACTDSGVGYLALWCAVPVIMVTYAEGLIAPGHAKNVLQHRYKGVNHKNVHFELVHGSWEFPIAITDRVLNFLRSSQGKQESMQ